MEKNTLQTKLEEMERENPSKTQHKKENMLSKTLPYLNMKLRGNVEHVDTDPNKYIKPMSELVFNEVSEGRFGFELCYNKLSQLKNIKGTLKANNVYTNEMETYYDKINPNQVIDHVKNKMNETVDGLCNLRPHPYYPIRSSKYIIERIDDGRKKHTAIFNLKEAGALVKYQAEFFEKN